MSDQPRPKSDLGPRVITAAIGVPAILAIALAAPLWAIWLLWSLAAAIGAFEWVAMCARERSKGLSLLTAAWVFVLLAVAFWAPSPLALFSAAAGGLIAVLVVSVWGGTTESAAPRMTGAASGALYCTLLFGSLVGAVAWGSEPSERAPDQSAWMLWPLLIIWSGDTGAYFAGRAFGRHRLAPRLSPKKTWEGAIGGTVASLAGGFAGAALFDSPPAAWVTLAVALPAAILGQVGDLAESALKRSTGVKDSGRILYGHGGILDRVDALLFAAPWFVVARALFF